MTHANDATPNDAHETRSAHGARKPRYQQIAETLREEIRRGEHAVGRFLSSEATDLLQYDESSDFHARYTDRLVADQQLAGWLQTRLGTECILLHGVRVGPF
jgi:hypothetical protein